MVQFQWQKRSSHRRWPSLEKSWRWSQCPRAVLLHFTRRVKKGVTKIKNFLKMVLQSFFFNKLIFYNSTFLQNEEGKSWNDTFLFQAHSTRKSFLPLVTYKNTTIYCMLPFRSYFLATPINIPWKCCSCWEQPRKFSFSRRFFL